MCILLECFVNFLDDPYYEPLPWFMIAQSLEAAEQNSQATQGTVTGYPENNIEMSN